MPQKSGIDFHDELRAIGVKSTIVFVTAYDQYAIQALKRQAYDYLVKPVDYEELVECLGRLHTDVSKQKQKEKVSIRFNTRTGCIIINPKDIGYIRADVNYSHIYLMNGQKETVSVNLGKVHQMTGIDNMFRVSRSLIVNIEYLGKIDYTKGVFILIQFNQTITGKASPDPEKNCCKTTTLSNSDISIFCCLTDSSLCRVLKLENILNQTS